MTNNYEIIKLDNNGIMLKLPSLYRCFSGSYIYYQQRKPFSAEDFDTAYTEFVFHFNKNDAKEKDEHGNLLPILMCYVTGQGKLACPDDILKSTRKNGNKIFFYSNSYSDFMLSTREPREYLTNEDAENFVRLFNTGEKL